MFAVIAQEATFLALILTAGLLLRLNRGSYYRNSGNPFYVSTVAIYTSVYIKLSNFNMPLFHLNRLFSRLFILTTFICFLSSDIYYHSHPWFSQFHDCLYLLNCRSCLFTLFYIISMLDIGSIVDSLYSTALREGTKPTYVPPLITDLFLFS